MSEKIAPVVSLEDHKFEKELPALMQEAAAPKPIPEDMANRLREGAEKHLPDNVISFPKPKQD